MEAAGPICSSHEANVRSVLVGVRDRLDRAALDPWIVDLLRVNKERSGELSKDRRKSVRKVRVVGRDHS